MIFCLCICIYTEWRQKAVVRKHFTMDWEESNMVCILNIQSNVITYLVYKNTIMEYKNNMKFEYWYYLFPSILLMTNLYCMRTILKAGIIPFNIEKGEKNRRDIGFTWTMSDASGEIMVKIVLQTLKSSYAHYYEMNAILNTVKHQSENVLISNI